MKDRMRRKDADLFRVIKVALEVFDREHRRLPGIEDRQRQTSLILQVIESIRRVKFAEQLGLLVIFPFRSDQRNEFFDPLKATILKRNAGEIDEAFLLVFLAIHFGRHGKSGWRLVRDVYGSLGEGPIWNWSTISD